MEPFTIPLVPEGDNAEFRLRDAYTGQPQRPNIVDYGTSLNVQGNLVEVVHGTMTPGGDPASLIVTEFRFSTLDPPRRFRHATITFRFDYPDSRDASPPAVVKISPEGFYAMNRSERPQEVSRGATIAVGGNFGPAANATLGYQWGLVETKARVDHAALTGIKTVLDRGVPPPNAARWSTAENKNDKYGVPSHLQLAILVKRTSSRKFRGWVDVSVKVDYRYEMERRRGRGVDPVTFDPGLPPQGLLGVDAANLGQVDLKRFMVIQSGPQTAG